ncbi:hypothetical protein CXB51_033957 [Gossypium anomalum]|uniref:DUF7745 domain-containing protein n=1 Tax=Gossypium anomalum TaxID=47600 RepID=A0A8J6CKA9_9ROSI|nr:hypothetical protein CXB51_033957 [Gossypium anomalum]
MENEFLNKVEDNAAVRIWSENKQLEKGDSLAEGWGNETKQLFYQNFGDLPYLLDIKVDKNLFRAITQFWNPAYSYFTFRKVNLVPTVEEYIALLRCPKVQIDRVYFRAANAQPFVKKLMSITGMSEQWPDIKKRDVIFALNIYGLVIFPKAIRHIDEAVADLFDRLGKGATPVLAILAETFRSLSACRKATEGRFIGCAQLLSEITAMPRRDDISEENWIALLRNLQEECVEWKASWLVPDEILYRCGSFDWVLLPGIWGAIGYASLLVLRQYRSRQFVPITHGLAQSEFSYKGSHYKKRIREITDA